MQSLLSSTRVSHPSRQCCPASVRPLARVANTRQRAVQRNASQPIGDRLLSAVPYLLPMCDGLRYGKFLVMQYPIFSALLAPVNVVARIYYSTPFLGFVAFFAIYLGIINNQNLDRSVRFNAMQAVLLDIILIVPSLLERTGGPPSGPLLQLYISGYNTIFLFVLASFFYGVLYNDLTTAIGLVTSDTGKLSA